MSTERELLARIERLEAQLREMQMQRAVEDYLGKGSSDANADDVAASIALPNNETALRPVFDRMYAMRRKIVEQEDAWRRKVAGQEAAWRRKIAAIWGPGIWGGGDPGDENTRSEADEAMEAGARDMAGMVEAEREAKAARQAEVDTLLDLAERCAEHDLAREEATKSLKEIKARHIDPPPPPVWAKNLLVGS